MPEQDTHERDTHGDRALEQGPSPAAGAGSTGGGPADGSPADGAADRPGGSAAASPTVLPDRSLGTRICFLLAGLLLVLGGYLLVTPLERPSSQGPPFGCGTALHPPTDSFARAVCGGINRQHALQAGAVGAAAVVLAGGGLLAFGPIRRRDDRWRLFPGGREPGPDDNR